MRRNLGKEAVALHSIKKSRRAKSTVWSFDLCPNGSNTSGTRSNGVGRFAYKNCSKGETIEDYLDYYLKDPYEGLPGTVDSGKTCTLSAKNQENVTALLITNFIKQMSKSELINCYRLLMNEKLRLERFLSIMSRNNEMVRIIL